MGMDALCVDSVKRSRANSWLRLPLLLSTVSLLWGLAPRSGFCARSSPPAAVNPDPTWRPTAEGFEVFDWHPDPVRVASFPLRAGCRCVAVVKGNVENRTGVPARVHSECLFGDIFGSRRCDCGLQLRSFLADVLGNAQVEHGILLYVRGHEGKGIGLDNKIRAYEIQDRFKVSPYDANRQLGFKSDLRRYGGARAAFHFLRVRSILLYTDDERKARLLGTIVGDTVSWDKARSRWQTKKV